LTSTNKFLAEYNKARSAVVPDFDFQTGDFVIGAQANHRNKP